jgi:hypothetical protein
MAIVIVKTSVQKWRSNKNRQKLPKPVDQKDTVCATEENQIEIVDNPLSGHAFDTGML